MINRVLETKKLTKKFEGLIAVDSVDYQLYEGELVGLIGPNGAGKTTFVNLITGYYIPDEGSVLFMDKNITGLSAEKRFALKIVRTFQLCSVFDDLQVIENLALAYLRCIPKEAPLNKMLLSKLLDFEDVGERADGFLNEFGLKDMTYERAGNLPLGNKRKLELAMAFITDPKLLLLDEPLAGLSETEIEELFNVINRHIGGKTILMVDHKVSKIMDFVRRLSVMHEGKIVADGKPDEVLQDPTVRKIYWGY